MVLGQSAIVEHMGNMSLMKSLVITMRDMKMKMMMNSMSCLVKSSMMKKVKMTSVMMGLSAMKTSVMDLSAMMVSMMGLSAMMTSMMG
jgi:hypothetical protein